MSKFDDCVATYKKAMHETLGIKEFNEVALTGIAKSLGPSIYLADASLVSCSDKVEKDRVKNNFLIKKLGMTDGEKLDAAVNAVCAKMGSSNRSKHRVVFYYLLAEHFGILENFLPKT